MLRLPGEKPVSLTEQSVVITERVLDPKDLKFETRSLLWALKKMPRQSIRARAAWLGWSPMKLQRRLKILRALGFITWGSQRGKVSTYCAQNEHTSGSKTSTLSIEHSNNTEGVYMRAKPSDDMDGTEDTPAPRVKARHSVMASNPALEVYRSAWTARYRVPCPARGPRFMREANEILEKCGSEESFRGAVERFFGCTERYVVEHKHELWLLNRNLSRYVAAHTHREGVERLRVL